MRMYIDHSNDYFVCRSEGPAQVFLLTLTWLLLAFGKESREKWRSLILSYDNMCHLNNLKVAKRDLPLPGKWLCFKVVEN